MTRGLKGQVESVPVLPLHFPSHSRLEFLSQTEGRQRGREVAPEGRQRWEEVVAEGGWMWGEVVAEGGRMWGEVVAVGGRMWGEVAAETLGEVAAGRLGEVAAALPFQCSLETRGVVEGCWKGPPGKGKDVGIMFYGHPQWSS